MGLLYWLVLRDRIKLNHSRLWLVFSLVMPLIVPFLSIFPVPNEISSISKITTGEILIQPQVSGENTLIEFNYYSVFTTLFFAFSSIFAIHYLVGLFRLLFIDRTSKLLKSNGMVIVFLSESTPPFSFFNRIYIQEDLVNSSAMNHEEQHSRMFHSIDLLMIGALKVIYWANPAFWFIVRELRSIHEFQADRAVLEQGVNIREYQQLLLSITMGNTIGLPVNQFTQSFIKKRITMMTKNKGVRSALLRWIVAAPLALLAIWFVSCNQKNSNENESKSDTIASEVQANPDARMESSDNKTIEVEKQAEFPGGQEAMGEFFSQNIKYPQRAKEDGITGTVYVSFTVDARGKVILPKVTKSASPELDAEALRVVNLMPKWTPAQDKGKAVAVEFTVPVKFALQ